MSLESQSLPSFKEGVGNKFHTPSISHRLLFPITAIIKSERKQYFFFRNRFVLYIVFMRIKALEKRRYLDAVQSEGLFFLLYKWTVTCKCVVVFKWKSRRRRLWIWWIIFKKICWKGLIIDRFGVCNICFILWKCKLMLERGKYLQIIFWYDIIFRQ